MSEVQNTQLQTVSYPESVSPAHGAVLTDMCRGERIDLDDDSDRYRDLSPLEQRIATARRDGRDVVDRQGRPRMLLGNGPQSQLVRATYPIAQRKEPVVSSVVTPDDHRRMYEAVAIANMQGLMLNAFLTVSWQVGGVETPGYVADLHDRLFELMRAWSRHKDRTGRFGEVPFAGIWVKEVGKRLGLHSHFLVHVPAPLFVAFREWAAKAVRKLLELPHPNYRLPAPSLRITHTSRLDDVADQWNVFRYLMKGVDEEAVCRIGDSHRRLLLHEAAGLKPRDQGKIIGPRVGRSRSLGPAARKQVEERLGALDLWLNVDEIDKYPYDDRYLRCAELGEQLLALEHRIGD